MHEKDSPLEIIISLLVLAAIVAQTYMVVNDATEGEAGRKLSHWWERAARPAVVRIVMWIDAHSITERMIIEEISPYLQES